MFVTRNLYQNDERWKKCRLGNSNETIGAWGGLLTSVTMMLNGMGHNETPETVNEKLIKVDGFYGALLNPGALARIWPDCAYLEITPCESCPAPVDLIDAALAEGKPVIVEVDWAKQAGSQTHFLLLKRKVGADYSVYDPYRYVGDHPEKEILLTRRYKYNGARLETEISAVLWFDQIR
jgi:hypothetical protein